MSLPLCAACAKEHRESKLKMFAIESTLVGNMPRLHQDGEYHIHDMNKHALHLKCEHGHDITVAMGDIPCWCEQPPRMFAEDLRNR